METNTEIITDRVKMALTLLFLKDEFLLMHDVKEETISARLCHYLGFLFPDYDCDLEYNRFGHTLTSKCIGSTTMEIARDLAATMEDILLPVGGSPVIEMFFKRPGHPTSAIPLKTRSALLTKLKKALERMGMAKPTIIEPDIVVHKRGDGVECDLLVVEVKKHPYHNRGDVIKDIIKLTACVDDQRLRYKHALFIRFFIHRGRPRCELFWRHRGLKWTVPPETFHMDDDNEQALLSALASYRKGLERESIQFLSRSFDRNPYSAIFSIRGIDPQQLPSLPREWEMREVPTGEVWVKIILRDSNGPSEREVSERFTEKSGEKISVHKSIARVHDNSFWEEIQIPPRPSTTTRDDMTQ